MAKGSLGKATEGRSSSAQSDELAQHKQELDDEKRLNVRMQKSVYKEFQHKVIDEDEQSLSAVVRRLIRQYLAE